MCSRYCSKIAVKSFMDWFNAIAEKELLEETENEYLSSFCFPILPEKLEQLIEDYFNYVKTS